MNILYKVGKCYIAICDKEAIAVSLIHLLQERKDAQSFFKERTKKSNKFRTASPCIKIKQSVHRFVKT